MTRIPREHGHEHVDQVSLYVLGALPAEEVPAAETQIADCAECRKEMAAMRPVVAAFVSWPAELLSLPPSAWERLSRRVAAEAGQPVLPPAEPPAEPEWEEPAPGITCQILATDAENGRTTMLVRLAPGAVYPPHRHAGVEELHMLEGELIVGEKTLRAGDYLRSEPGTSDHHVWSPTGCAGVLITSARDALL